MGREATERLMGEGSREYNKGGQFDVAEVSVVMSFDLNG